MTATTELDVGISMPPSSLDATMKTTPIARPRKEPDEQDQHQEEDCIDDWALYRLLEEDDDTCAGENVAISNCSSSSIVPAARCPLHILAAGGEILQPGDHVYMECNLYQHHGIVLHVEAAGAREDNTIPEIPEQQLAVASPPSPDENDSNDNKQKNQQQQRPYILIAEFTNVALEQETNDGTGRTMFTSASTASNAVGSGADGGGVEGGFRLVREYNASTVWHKVKYKANPMEMFIWRPGTCSSALPSPVATILMRVLFLRDCRHEIPKYHLFASNCETVAVWCTTGTWQTLQGKGRTLQLSTAAVLGSGLLLPAIGIGIATAAAASSLWHTKVMGDTWNQTEAKLNRAFEWYALGRALTKFIFE